jgi:hypothetical protein
MARPAPYIRMVSRPATGRGGAAMHNGAVQPRKNSAEQRGEASPSRMSQGQQNCGRSADRAARRVERWETCFDGRSDPDGHVAVAKLG